ncbi:hypothetical protein I7I48_09062 [Histoplasma ohiense]|nr:hypothetical protein I7I48_09062 [Histoplasma ohiense (nom. inval.)]
MNDKRPTFPISTSPGQRPSSMTNGTRQAYNDDYGGNITTAHCVLRTPSGKEPEVALDVSCLSICLLYLESINSTGWSKRPLPSKCPASPPR